MARTTTSTTLFDNRPYLLGLDGLAPLADGASLDVPQGVTVMVDAGALFKMSEANLDVGTSTEGVDRGPAHCRYLVLLRTGYPSILTEMTVSAEIPTVRAQPLRLATGVAWFSVLIRIWNSRAFS